MLRAGGITFEVLGETSFQGSQDQEELGVWPSLSILGNKWETLP